MLGTDPRYISDAYAAAALIGAAGKRDVVRGILAQWTCEKGNADAYPPVRNNPGNLSRDALAGVAGIPPFHVDSGTNPQPGNPIVTFATGRDGARAYGLYLAARSRYAAALVAARRGDGLTFALLVCAAGYGTGSACTRSAYLTIPEPPALVTAYAIHVAHGATVRVYELASTGCILRYEDRTWIGHASSASASAARHRSTCDRTSGATTTRVLSGVYRGKVIRVNAAGVTLRAR